MSNNRNPKLLGGSELRGGQFLNYKRIIAICAITCKRKTLAYQGMALKSLDGEFPHRIVFDHLIIGEKGDAVGPGFPGGAPFAP